MTDEQRSETGCIGDRMRHYFADGTRALSVSRDTARRRVLEDLGSRGAVVEELLAYSAPGCEPGAARGLSFPLEDEAHIGDWRAYAEEADRVGTFAALAERLVQLRFPVREGLSSEEIYRAATRRGILAPEHAEVLALERPDGLELVIHPTLAGHVPILIAGTRGDFEQLVCALTNRNEPESVPRSMGACMVAGLNNWDRVAGHRRQIEARHGSSLSESAWADELRRLIPQKSLYQDRLILLSRGPYSAVPAGAMAMDEGAWEERSLILRREHECAHYFTRRALGFMRNNAFDEILADFAGLVAAFGSYDPGRALLFLGLEELPRVRPGGRLENYLGEPRLSANAQAVLHALVAAAVRNLAGVAAPLGPSAAQELLPLLGPLTLEELASPDLPVVVAAERNHRLDAAERGDPVDPARR